MKKEPKGIIIGEHSHYSWHWLEGCLVGIGVVLLLVLGGRGLL